MHLRSTLLKFLVLTSRPSAHGNDSCREGWSWRLRGHQRVRGLYSGSFLIFSFSVSLSSLAITRECE